MLHEGVPCRLQGQTSGTEGMRTPSPLGEYGEETKGRRAVGRKLWHEGNVSRLCHR